MPAPTITLAKGAHHPPGDDCGNPQRCLFEWYNWLTRRQHTDACPPGVSPVLHQFGIRLNDVLGDAKRQDLVRFLPNGQDRLAGTEHDGKDETRGYMALDWLIRTYTPAWLDLAGLTAEAAALRDLRRISDLVAAQSAGPLVLEAVAKSAAAWAAAGDAAGAAAGAAAWDAAGAAAWDAAWDAARDAAGAAAWDAAWAAAGAAAGAAAWDAAGAAAGAAARAAARDKLAPTVSQLQDSAIALYDAMITGVWPVPDGVS
jgi:hypothetical protein